MLSLHEVSISRLKVFCSVVECGGFSAAQARLNTSAATISVRMKELETQLGMTLCRRGRSGFHVTDQGKSVYEAARNIFNSIGNFNLEVASIRDTLTGEIKIGLQANLGTNPALRIAQTLRRFHQRQNTVEFNFEEALSAEQEVRTLEGRYDLCIGLFPNRIPNLDYTPVCRERVELYCSTEHPLWSETDESLVLDKISACAMVASGQSQDMVLIHQRNLAAPSATTESMDAMAMLILSGHYLGFLPTHFAAIWEEKNLIRPLVSSHFGRTLDFQLIMQKGWRSNSVVSLFVSDFIAEQRLQEPNNRNLASLPGTD